MAWRAAIRKAVRSHSQRHIFTVFFSDHLLLDFAMAREFRDSGQRTHSFLCPERLDTE